MVRKLLVVFVSILVMLNLITPISASVYEEDGKIEGENKSFTVCIDPGHQEKGDPKGEPIAPGSGNKKPRVSSGTAGKG